MGDKVIEPVYILLLDYFVDKNTKGEDILRQTNGYCRFLKIEEGIAACTIYESRPRICRDYVCIEPGKDKCKLQRHYSVVELGKQ